jgi:hypothetical protein
MFKNRRQRIKKREKKKKRKDKSRVSEGHHVVAGLCIVSP